MNWYTYLSTSEKQSTTPPPPGSTQISRGSILESATTAGEDFPFTFAFAPSSNDEDIHSEEQPRMQDPESGTVMKGECSDPSSPGSRNVREGGRKEKGKERGEGERERPKMHVSSTEKGVNAPPIAKDDPPSTQRFRELESSRNSKHNNPQSIFPPTLTLPPCLCNCPACRSGAEGKGCDDIGCCGNGTLSPKLSLYRLPFSVLPSYLSLLLPCFNPSFSPYHCLRSHADNQLRIFLGWKEMDESESDPDGIDMEMVRVRVGRGGGGGRFHPGV